MSFFCLHKWKTVDKIESKSPFEVAKELGVNISGKDLLADNIVKLMARQILFIITCEKCGKLKSWKQ